jgi:hypothetical protein
MVKTSNKIDCKLNRNKRLITRYEAQTKSKKKAMKSIASQTEIKGKNKQ